MGGAEQTWQQALPMLHSLGVYKLACPRDNEGQWVDKLKLSEERGKMILPGILQVKRYRQETGIFKCDVVYDRRFGIGGFSYPLGFKNADLPVPQVLTCVPQDLLQPIYDRGDRVYTVKGLESIWRRAAREIKSLPSPLRQLGRAATPVSLDVHLFHRKSRLEEQEGVVYSVQEPKIRR